MLYSRHNKNYYPDQPKRAEETAEVKVVETEKPKTVTKKKVAKKKRKYTPRKKKTERKKDEETNI